MTFEIDEEVGFLKKVWTCLMTAKIKFVDLADVYMGVNVRRFLREMQKMVQPLLDLPPASFDLARPRIAALPEHCRTTGRQGAGRTSCFARFDSGALWLGVDKHKVNDQQNQQKC